MWKTHADRTSPLTLRGSSGSVSQLPDITLSFVISSRNPNWTTASAAPGKINKRGFENKMRKNWKAFALMMSLILAVFVGSNSAQSGDPDNPTPLSSSELKGNLGGANKESYYSFVAGPGKVTVTVDIKASEGVASMTLNFSAADSADALVMPLATHRGSKREVDSFDLDERQTVVMKLASTGSYKGSYVIRLDGAVNFKSDAAAPPPKNSTGGFSEDCLPKSGTLSFVMPDGTVQKIKLNGVQKVSHKP